MYPLVPSVQVPSVQIMFILPTYSLTHLLTYLLTYLLTWIRVLLEKLTALQLIKKFLAFYGT